MDGLLEFLAQLILRSKDFVKLKLKVNVFLRYLIESQPFFYGVFKTKNVNLDDDLNLNQASLDEGFGKFNKIECDFFRLFLK